jgi:hypothetical protein
MQKPTGATHQGGAAKAMEAILFALFAFLVVMLFVNVYLLIGPWFHLHALFGIGVVLVASAAYARARSRLSGYACLIVGLGGAALIGKAVTTEYWHGLGDKSLPIVCEVRGRDGSAITSAKCQVLLAKSAESAGEGVTDSRGIASFSATMSVKTGYTWLHTTRCLSAEYVVRVSAPNFQSWDEPLVSQRNLIDGKPIVLAVALAPSP